MSAGSIYQGPSADSFLAVLNPFRRRIIGFNVGRLVLLACAALLSAFIVLLWADTVWEMSSAVRWWTSRGAIVVALVALVSLAAYRVRRTTHTSVAKVLDRSSNSGGEVLAGLQLATNPVAPNHDLSRGLAQIATARAANRVQTFAPDLVTDWIGIRSAGFMLAAALAASLMIAAFVPSIAWNQVQRFLYPASDIPPYTGVLIELELESPSVLYGADAFAKAIIQSGSVDRVQLVVKAASGQEQVLPMLAQNSQEYQAILTRVTEPLTIYARSGSSRSAAKQLEVQLTPKIVSSSVQITPPAYTRAAVYRGAVPEKGIAGLVGTEVQWEITSNRPLAKGILRVTYRDGNEESFELSPSSSDGEATTVTATVALSKAGTFELSVFDIAGLQSQENVTGSLSILEDRRPIVRITQPRQISIATPDVRLPVVVLAEDDYGITNLTLFRSLNGSPATPVRAEVDGTARAQASWELPLESYGLEEGDEIQLFARTEDNDPSGAKGAESPITRIQIISVAHFQEMMMQQKGAQSMQAKYQAARRYFEQLDNALREVEEAQKELEANPDSAEAAAKLQEKLEAARQAAAQAAEQLDKLSRQAMPIDIDQELAKELAEMAKQARTMSEHLGDMQAGAKNGLEQSQQEQIEQMRHQAGGLQKDLKENAIDPMNQMQAMLPLMTDQAAFSRLVEQQRDLSERLRGLQNADASTPETARRIADLEAEQEQLKQSLSELLDNIEQHAEALPENEDTRDLKATALEFVEAVRQSEASTEMSKAQENLLGNQFSDSQANAQKAAEILESFLSQCNGMGDQASQACKAKFNPGKFGNSMQQMMEMMGMKPGSSGMKPGGKPGMGLGWGRGGGYSQRMPGPQDVGMYGSLPMPQAAPNSGSGDRESMSGAASSHQIGQSNDSENASELQARGEAAGQGMNAVPANYRSKVSEYFRVLNEQLNRETAE